MIQEDVLLHLARAIRLLPFEARKDTQTIFSYSLRFTPPQAPQSQPPAVNYMVNKQSDVIIELCRGYEYAESAMTCGSILREALKVEEIAKVILYDEPGRQFKVSQVDPKEPTSGEGTLWRFFNWIHHGSFEVNTDAFTTFRVSPRCPVAGWRRLTWVKEIITRHKTVVADYLAANYDRFFTLYNDTLVLSPSYVTKRQSIKLLGEILLDRANYNVMMAYVADGDNLKLCMRLLRNDSKMVQYESFHVFKASLPRAYAYNYTDLREGLCGQS